MRIARVRVERGDDGHPSERAAIVSPSGEHVSVLCADVEVLDLLASDPATREELAQRVESEVYANEVILLAPILPPTIRDFSVFEQHIEGIGLLIDSDPPVPDVWYESPFCYFSNPHAINGPGADVALPPGCQQLDFELEVAVIIGRPGRDLTPAAAAAHIAGYTILNDWSARDLQLEEMKLGLGTCKGKDFANTLGPWIVTPDELETFRVGDRLDLTLRSKVNGRELGSDTLASMAWSFEELIAYASRGTWVRPGDVLGSGTCGGGCLLELWGRHGRDFHPPLQTGDVVALTAEGIGTLTNSIVAGAPAIPLPPARRPGEALSS